MRFALLMICSGALLGQTARTLEFSHVDSAAVRTEIATAMRAVSGLTVEESGNSR